MTSRWTIKDAVVASQTMQMLRRLHPVRPSKINLMSSLHNLKTLRPHLKIAAVHMIQEILFSRILSQMLVLIASMTSVSNSSNIFQWRLSLRKTESDTRRSNSTGWSLPPMTLTWGDKLLLLMIFAKPILSSLNHSSIIHTVEWAPKFRPTMTISTIIPSSHSTLRSSTTSSVLTVPRDPLPNGFFPQSGTPTRKSEEHTWDSSLEMHAILISGY